MRSRNRPISTGLLLSGALLSTGCAHQAISPSPLELTVGDRTEAADPARPVVGQLAPPAPTGREEREYLSRTVIKPLLGLTLLQEATTAAERQRANGVVAKVDAYNAASKPKRKKILGVF